MIELRYPDKPERSAEVVLPMMDDGRHIALSKLDGWRCLTVVEDGKARFVSRALRTLPVGERITGEANRLIREGKLPNGTVLDGEWMKRRPGWDGPEMLYVFCVLVQEGVWVGGHPFSERWKYVNDLGLPVDDIQTNETPGTILLPASTDTGIAAFYERNRGVGRTEGVVIYKKNGKAFGSAKGSMKVREMIKVKWRDGLVPEDERV